MKIQAIFALPLLFMVSFTGAEDLSSEVSALRNNGKWKEASALAAENLEKARKSPDASREGLLEALEILNLNLLKTRRYHEALATSLEQLELAEALSIRVSDALYGLSLIGTGSGDFATANTRALAALEACDENNRELSASILVQLVYIQSLTGTPEATDASFARIPEVCPEPTEELAVSIAVIYTDALVARSDFEASLRVLTEALDKLERSPDSKAINRAVLKSEIAGVHLAAGRFAEGKQIIDEVLPVIQEEAGAVSDELGGALRTRGLILKRMRNDVAAEKDLKQSYLIREELFGPTSMDTLSSRERWCGALSEIDEPAAMLEYEAFLPIALEVYGESGEYILAAINLAYIYNRTEGRGQEGIKLLEIALRSDLANPQTQPFRIILTLFNLTSVCQNEGNFESAHRYAKQLEELESEFDALSPSNLLAAYCALCYQAIHDNDKERAQRFADLRADSFLRSTREILSFAPAADRLAYVGNATPYNCLGSSDHFSRLADVVLQSKGIVLDSMVREKRLAVASKDPHVASLSSELADLQMAYRNAEFQGVEKADLSEIGEEISRVEEALSRAVGVGDFLGGMDVTAEQVTNALPPDAALIEFVSFHHVMTGVAKNTWSYGALVYLPGQQPKWVAMAEKDNLNRWMGTLEYQVRHGPPEEVENRCRRIHDYVWQWCQDELPPEVKTVYISATGGISYVPFAALVRPDGKFLGEFYEFRYLNSGRDLLRAPSESPERGKFVIVGNPEFASGVHDSDAVKRNAPEALATAARAADIDDMFRPLPGAEAEAKAIYALASGHGEQCDLLIGSDATEGALRSLRRPRTLHLATHGFWLFDHERANHGMGIFANPMYRGGIALSHADNTFRTWRSGKMDVPNEDGILLADEVADLDLMGTRLVTLSACETGRGVSYGSEGKIGLERAFLQAGAENVLASLWAIPDKESADFMKAFYASLEKTDDPGKSLAEVQRLQLVALREAHGIAHAVRSVGGFVLNSAVGAIGPVTKLSPGTTLEANFESSAPGATEWSGEDGEAHQLPWNSRGVSRIANDSDCPGPPPVSSKVLLGHNGEFGLVSGKIDLSAVPNESVRVSLDFRTFEDSANSDWESDDYIEAWIEGSADGLSFSRLPGPGIIPRTSGDNSKTTHDPSNPESDDLEKLQLPDGASTTFTSPQDLSIPPEIRFIRLHISGRNNSASERFLVDNLVVQSINE